MLTMRKQLSIAMLVLLGAVVGGTATAILKREPEPKVIYVPADSGPAIDVDSYDFDSLINQPRSFVTLTLGEPNSKRKLGSAGNSEAWYYRAIWRQDLAVIYENNTVSQVTYAPVVPVTEEYRRMWMRGP